MSTMPFPNQRPGMFGASPFKRKPGPFDIQIPDMAAGNPLTSTISGPAEFSASGQPFSIDPNDLGPLPQLPQKQSFFGEGGTGRHIAGALGDALMQMGGMRPMYMPMMQERREAQAKQQAMLAEMEQRKYEPQRVGDSIVQMQQDGTYKPLYTAPQAEKPYRWESNDGSLMEVGPDGEPRVIYKDPSPKINWIRADNGDGSFSMVPVGPNGPIGTHQGSPTTPVGKLRPLGGPTPNASGNFRP